MATGTDRRPDRAYICKDNRLPRLSPQNSPDARTGRYRSPRPRPPAPRAQVGTHVGGDDFIYPALPPCATTVRSTLQTIARAARIPGTQSSPACPSRASPCHHGNDPIRLRRDIRRRLDHRKLQLHQLSHHAVGDYSARPGHSSLTSLRHTLVSRISEARYVAASLKWPIHAANRGHRVTRTLLRPGTRADHIADRDSRSPEPPPTLHPARRSSVAGRCGYPEHPPPTRD
jgi:hypothetical protein